MASLTIRDLDDETKRLLRMRAAEKGVSMEAEARAILRDAVAPAVEETGEWYRKLRAIVQEVGGFDEVFAGIPDRKAEDDVPTSRRVPFAGDPEFDDAARRDAS